MQLPVRSHRQWVSALSLLLPKFGKSFKNIGDLLLSISAVWLLVLNLILSSLAFAPLPVASAAGTSAPALDPTPTPAVGGSTNASTAANNKPTKPKPRPIKPLRPAKLESKQAAQQWFYGQRALPNKTTPPGAREKALKQKAKIPAPKGHSASGNSSEFQALSGGTSWTPVNPSPTAVHDDIFSTYGLVSGRVTALAYDTTNSILYAGADGGGLWKSADGGATWNSLLDSQPSMVVGAVALDPTSPQVIYVGTGEANFNLDGYYSAGILKSTDGGTSWTLLGQSTFGGSLTSGGNHISKIAVDPHNSQRVLVAADNGLWLSTDGGTSWTKKLGASGKPVISDLILDGNTNPSTVYAAWGYINGDSNNGVYKSGDGGNTFSQLGNGAPSGTGFGRIGIAQAPSNPNRLYLVASNPDLTSALYGASLGVWTSSDAGANWTQTVLPFDPLSPVAPDLFGDDLGLPTPTEHGWYSMTIAVDPISSSTVYIGGINLFKSTDNGASFSDITNVYTVPIGTLTPHPDQHALVFVGGTDGFFVGNDGGVFSTQNGGGSWSANNNGLAITDFYAGSTTTNFSTNAMIWGGAQGTGTQKYDPNNPDPTGARWIQYLSGDGGFTATDPAHPDTAYGEQPYLSIFKTADGGQSWTSAINGINSGQRLYIAPFVMDPTNSNRLLAGTDQLYQTNDGAANWSAISPSLAADATKPFGAISAIGIAPSQTNIIYVGTGDGKLWTTTNNGTNWNDITTGTVGTSGRYVTSLAVNPTDPQDVVVTFSGFANDTATGSGTHVYHSTNSGGTWTDISAGLPDSPVNSVVRHPTNANVLYIGSDSGFFFTSNDGTSWSQYQTGLPNVIISQIFTDANFTTFVAATHGRSMFSLDTSAVPLVSCDPLVVTSNTDDGTGANCGTFTFAINQAKTATLPVTISFSVTSLTLTGTLPNISNNNGVTVTIDGGCSVVNSRGLPGVHLNAGIGAGSTGLNLVDKVVVKGLSITGFSSYAVNIQGSNNELSCNWLGTADGLTAAANGGGVQLGTVSGTSADNNKLGELDVAESGNLISGNTNVGIQVNNGANNEAHNNWIDLQKDGLTLLRNGGGGVYVEVGGQLYLDQDNRVGN